MTYLELPVSIRWVLGPAGAVLGSVVTSVVVSALRMDDFEWMLWSVPLFAGIGSRAALYYLIGELVPRPVGFAMVVAAFESVWLTFSVFSLAGIAWFTWTDPGGQVLDWIAIRELVIYLPIGVASLLMYRELRQSLGV